MRTFWLLPLSVFAACGALCPGVCRADSITIQGTRHDGVQVIDAQGFYRVFAPDGTEIATVSKRRMDITDVSIDRNGPVRFPPRPQSTERADNEGNADAPVRKVVLHGDPAAAAESLAAYDAAMADEARAREEQRRRADQMAEEERQRAYYAMLARRVAATRQIASESGDSGAVRQNEAALQDAARAARMSAEAQQDTARALREQTAAVKEQTLALQNLRESQRFKRR